MQILKLYEILLRKKQCIYKTILYRKKMSNPNIFINGGKRRQAFQVTHRQSIAKIADPISKQFSFQAQLDRTRHFEGSSFASSKKFRILKSTKKQCFRKYFSKQKNAEIAGVVSQIEDRASTFYQLAFKNSEKSGKKRILKQFFELSQRHLKGTMVVGQLWSNTETSKYLKQNRISLTKLKLIEELRNIKRLMHKQRQRQQSQESCTAKNITLNTTKSIMTEKSFNHTSSSLNEVEDCMKSLRNQIKFLRNSSENYLIEQKFKKMEKQAQQINKVQKRYFMTLIEML